MNKVLPPIWTASEARHRFSDLVDAVVGGEPQFVRRRDGREVVVVSKAYFEGTRPSVKGWILDDSLKLEADDPFFTDIKRARTLLGASLPHPYLNEDTSGDAVRVGHKRSKREPEPTA
jgi:prevent-host-death family protein